VRLTSGSTSPGILEVVSQPFRRLTSKDMTRKAAV
jgi:hypothetical protein